MANLKISQYVTEELTPDVDSLYDVSELISTGPDVFDSRRIKHSTLLSIFQDGNGIFTAGNSGSSVPTTFTANLTDNLTFGSNRVYLDESGAFIGIGTATQNGSEILGVNGNTYVSGGIGSGIAPPANAGHYVRYAGGNTGLWISHAGGATNTDFIVAEEWVGIGTQSQVASERVTVSSDATTNSVSDIRIKADSSMSGYIAMYSSLKSGVDSFYRNKFYVSSVGSAEGQVMAGTNAGSLYLSIEDNVVGLGADGIGLKLDKSNTYIGIGTLDAVPNTRLDLDGSFAVRSKFYDLVASVNDLTTEDIGTYEISNTSTGSLNITGFGAPKDGQIIRVHNIAADDVVMTHLDAASAATNQFFNKSAANVTLTTGDNISYQYSVALGNWREI